jgi:glycosyltransferase involved in cell wall biosynthesis
MCQSLNARGVETVLATTDADGPGTLRVTRGVETRFSDVPTFFFARRLGDGFKYSPRLAAWLSANVPAFDLAHVHAVFSHSSVAAGRACRRAGVPYVLRPLGSLAPWGLRRKRLRKELLWRLAARRLIAGAARVHYTTEEERTLAEDAVGPTSGVVIPLGLDESWLRHDPVPPSARKRRVVALGRLHPVKNLELLIRAFRLAARGDLAAWELVIAGEGEAAYRLRLEALVREAGPGGEVSFSGWVEEPAKLALLADAGLFVQVSHQESFGLSLLEAMALGVPAVVTRSVSLAAAVERAAAGWVSGDRLEELSETLREAMTNVSARTTRSARARNVAGGFRWPRVAQDLEELYREIVDSHGLESRERLRSLTPAALRQRGAD